MKLKKLAVAAAVTAVMGIAGQAQAAEGAVAQASVQLTNFALGTYTAGVFTPFVNTQFATLNITDNAFNNALLNGTPAFNFATSNILGATVDAAQACVGTCGGQNNFAPSAVPPATLFSRSDSTLSGTPISIAPGSLGPGTPPVLIPAGATARTIAETSIPGGTNGGSAGTQINLTSTLSFVLNSNISNAAISFDGASFLRAWTAAGSANGTLAGANIAWSIGLTGTDGTNLQWSPNGTILGGTAIGLTEINDSCNLNDNAQATNNQPSAALSCSGAFLAVANAGITLRSGVGYSLNINHSSQTNAQSVPEPASLALLGIGLLGFGVAGLRKKSV